MTRPTIKAVIVAAGAGRRLPGSQPKVFRELAGRPIVEYSLVAVEAARTITSAVVVVPPGMVSEARALFGTRFERVAALVEGGAERQDSVRNGAEAAGECDVVVVHDAARPFAPPELFDAVAAEAARAGAAVAAAPATDTIKETDGAGGISRTLDRSRIVITQTPQAFRRDWLFEALDRARSDSLVVTDEASLIEGMGRPVRTVPGTRTNLKITEPADLEIARAIAEDARRVRSEDDGAAGETRIGLGEDIHPLETGRRMMIGGVEIPFDKGPRGHSDGDPLLHAFIDALSGAAGLPSIGEQFPDDDPAWAGAPSIEMLGRVGASLAGAGWRIVNLDGIVLCDAPKIAPRAGEMRSVVAGALGIEPARVGVRGKSAEGLGPEGRGEAISARAVVLLCRSGTGGTE